MSKRPANYHVIHLWIELTRALQDIAEPGADHFGTGLGDLLIRCAVFIGTVEGKPMSSHKISDYIGISRATVIRRLRELESRGIVERHGAAWCTPKTRLDALPDLAAAERLVHAAHDRLPKLSS